MDVNHKDNVTDRAAQVALSRAGFYRLFGRLFRNDVDDELLAKIQSPPLNETLKYLGLELPLETDNREQLQALTEEYTRLFVGPGQHLPPYASVQKTPDGLLNGPEAAAVKRFIKGTGFQFDNAYKDYPDHISTELEFMETLIQREYDALVAGDNEEVKRSQSIQTDFFVEHINTWVPVFCDRVKDIAEHPFYKQLATMTQNFIETEQDYLAEFLTVIDSTHPKTHQQLDANQAL
jgi:TorA maturation chaperone TorD